MLVRHARTDDASAIAAIYNDAIARTTSSFWTEPRPVEEIRAAIPAEASGHPWLVAEEACVVGFAWSKPWNPREAYARTVEVSVYVAEGARGRGVGRALYETLFDRLAGLGHRRVIAGIALPNEASVRLHEAMGMRPVGIFEGIGEKFGREIDVGYWQGRLS
ncbi:MAG: N-acetyltransferase family protein [Planctomycetota bacterium]